jgi:NOL1/NOP2/fmu family ribosome biogenesis protein
MGAETLHHFQKADDVFAFDPEFLPDLNLILTVLKLRKSGLRLGEIIREEFVPNHELAMSTLQSNQIPSIQLDLKTSLQYLRRETIETAVAQKGWSLVQYKGISLGWIKQVQGKAKNHYPLNWRILMRG